MDHVRSPSPLGRRGGSRKRGRVFFFFWSRSRSRKNCRVSLTSFFFIFSKMPFSQETRLAPPFPSASQFRCPKCGRANASLDHFSSLELGSAETPSCCCCSSCGFVFDDGAGGFVGDGDAGGTWGSRSAAYGGGFSQFDSMAEIANGIRDNAAAGNWVSEDGTVAGKASFAVVFCSHFLLRCSTLSASRFANHPLPLILFQKSLVVPPRDRGALQGKRHALRPAPPEARRGLRQARGALRQGVGAEGGGRVCQGDAPGGAL